MTKFTIKPIVWLISNGSTKYAYVDGLGCRLEIMRSAEDIYDLIVHTKHGQNTYTYNSLEQVQNKAKVIWELNLLPYLLPIKRDNK